VSTWVPPGDCGWRDNTDELSTLPPTPLPRPPGPVSSPERKSEDLLLLLDLRLSSEELAIRVLEFRTAAAVTSSR